MEILFWGYLIGVLVTFGYLHFINTGGNTLLQQFYLSLIWPVTWTVYVFILKIWGSFNNGGR